MGVIVRNVTNLSRSGLSDWLIQRFSAVVLAAYTVFILVFLVASPELTYNQWAMLFSHTTMKIFTLLAILSLVGHAWVGLWTVATDYLKPLAIRFLFLAVVAITLFVYLIVTITALWG